MVIKQIHNILFSRLALNQCNIFTCQHINYMSDAVMKAENVIPLQIIVYYIINTNIFMLVFL